jgi:hypothetical protein
VKIGVGVPNPVPGTPGTTFAAWAKRAEEHGFSGLVEVDREPFADAPERLVDLATWRTSHPIEILCKVLVVGRALAFTGSQNLIEPGDNKPKNHQFGREWASWWRTWRARW